MMNAMKNARGVISTQSSVTIQCYHDPSEIGERREAYDKNETKFFQPVGDLITNNIHAKELVFQRIRARSVKGPGARAAQPVSSALNGLSSPVNIDDHDNEESILGKSIRFIGIACTDTFIGDASNSQTQLTVRVKGTDTIMNNSTVNIEVGDVIVWQIPTKIEYEQIKQFIKDRIELNYTSSGDWVSKEKVMLMTIPYQEAQKNLARLIEELQQNISEDLFKMDDEVKFSKDKFKEVTKQIIISIYPFMEELDRRKIGRALSSARPGQPFDILLC